MRKIILSFLVFIVLSFCIFYLFKDKETLDNVVVNEEGVIETKAIFISSFSILFIDIVIICVIIIIRSGYKIKGSTIPINKVFLSLIISIISFLKIVLTILLLN